MAKFLAEVATWAVHSDAERSLAQLRLSEPDKLQFSPIDEPLLRHAFSPRIYLNETFESKKAHFFLSLSYSYRQDLAARISAPI